MRFFAFLAGVLVVGLVLAMGESTPREEVGTTERRAVVGDHEATLIPSKPAVSGGVEEHRAGEVEGRESED